MKNHLFPNHRVLVDVAMGRAPAELVIRKGQWVCVQSGEIIPDTDIAIRDGWIAYVGPDARHTIDSHTQILEAEENYMVPGLLDGHMHIESGMLTVTEFTRAVIPHGTTGMFVDPHEIANVFGLKGVRWMVEQAAQQPIHVYVQVPSCVPSAPGFETPGATLSIEEIKEAIQWPGVIGLGEMMNFPGVIDNSDKPHSEMEAARKEGKVIGGHYASQDLGLPFHGYAAGGPQDDHEGTRLEDALARARQGMRVMMRLGSAWHDVAAQVRAVTELGLDSRHFILCTDDSHSDTLVSEGHMDRVIRHAISHNLPPMKTIQMATVNTAEYFGLGDQIGMIAPGRFADIILVKDLSDFQVDTVIARGRILKKNGQVAVELPESDYPDWLAHSVHLPRLLQKKDFCIPAKRESKVTANIIEVIENQAPTRHLHLPIQVQNGEIKADIQQDIAKLALLERHKGTGRIQMGLVKGFGFNESCAVASTVAHDCHHMIVVGTDEENMVVAANHLAAVGGGQIVVKNGEVIGLVELVIAGLMSKERAEVVSKKAATVLNGYRACGCFLNNPNMQLSLLSLVVIPELRISDLGLFDVTRFEFLPIIE